ncbi:hypothetical protein [Thermococcus gorgonarius]|uniref:hypothetical protein n=1 Tax=Thermococcus gorgonarius TaxID=71997 RepID=UPI0018DFC4A9|nr:hypothetical protein [Thermococcus gorgonarius]
MPRGFGGPVMRGSFLRRRGFGWWWLGPFAFILIFARIALLALPLIVLALMLYALVRG